MRVYIAHRQTMKTVAKVNCIVFSALIKHISVAIVHVHRTMKIHIELPLFQNPSAIQTGVQSADLDYAMYTSHEHCVCICVVRYMRFPSSHSIVLVTKLILFESTSKPWAYNTSSSFISVRRRTKSK